LIKKKVLNIYRIIQIDIIRIKNKLETFLLIKFNNRNSMVRTVAGSIRERKGTNNADIVGLENRMLNSLKSDE
jgi:hypothetical protein